MNQNCQQSCVTDASIVVHSVLPALKSRIFFSPFYPLWVPVAVSQLSWRLKKKKAQKEYRSPIPGSGPWFVFLYLTQERPVHVVEDANILEASVCLAGPLPSCYPDTSVRLDNVPVPIDKRGLKHQQSPRFTMNRCMAHRTEQIQSYRENQPTGF